MNTSIIRSPSTYNSGRPKRIILSIDGGGVRGAVVARILNHLEIELSRRGINKPLYKLFDFFTGTSTGALIACGIGHMKMSAANLSDNFYNHKTAEKIMKKTIVDRIFGIVQGCPKYNGKGKREVLNEVVKMKKFQDTENMVMIPVYDITTQNPVFFKSWKPSRASLLNVLDASSAAPAYFPSVEYIPGRWGVDSSIFAHNPSLCAYVEMLKLFSVKDDIRILSLGTGFGVSKSLKRETQSWGGIEWMVQGDLMDMIMDAPMESEDYQITNLCKINNHRYLRIDSEIDGVHLDDCDKETIEKLKEHGDDIWREKRDEILSLILD